jgi:nucleotidyltransferase/DNA polymerase involved in DNA repair
MEKLEVKTCGELAAVSVGTLQKHFGEEKGRWLWAISRGQDDDQVKEREHSQQFSAGKVTTRLSDALGSQRALSVIPGLG